MNKRIKEIRDRLRPGDLHFRPDCDDYKCGAHKSWNEGFEAGYAEAQKDVASLIKALSDSREICALMAEGEGDCAGVYMSMSKSALEVLNRALAEWKGKDD